MFTTPRICVDFSVRHYSPLHLFIYLFFLNFILGKTGNIPETVSDSHMESIGGQSNNQDFDYQETENDYDWYYNPGKRPEVEGN